MRHGVARTLCSLCGSARGPRGVEPVGRKKYQQRTGQRPHQHHRAPSRLGKTLSALVARAAIALAGRYLMRPLFRFVAQSGIREILVAFALPIIVGITLLMQFLGLSAALATFLAGMVLAKSEYRHELEMDLDPFKGLLLVAFFMAVVAGIDFKLLMSNPTLC